MDYIFKKPAPVAMTENRSVWQLMINDPCQLKGDEILLSYLSPRGWIFQGTDGELIYVYHTGAPFGCFERADNEFAASLKRRYDTRAGLKAGDLITATVMVEGEKEKIMPVTYENVTENCRFESFADAEKRFAWVIRFDGSRCKTGDFEAYTFSEREPVWTKLNDHWVLGYFSRTINAEEIELDFYEGGPENCGFVSAAVKIKDIRASDESVIPSVGERVTALVDNKWKECIFVAGTLGNFTVVTKYLRRRKRAILVQPLERSFLEAAA